MGLPKPCLAGALALALSSCVAAGPMPGTPEFTAAQISRGYDCGLRIDRGRVLARLGQDERPRFLAASSILAVKAYKAPRRCGASEREAVRKTIEGLANLPRHEADGARGEAGRVSDVEKPGTWVRRYSRASVLG